MVYYFFNYDKSSFKSFNSLFIFPNILYSILGCNDKFLWSDLTTETFALRCKRVPVGPMFEIKFSEPFVSSSEIVDIGNVFTIIPVPPFIVTFLVVIGVGVLHSIGLSAAGTAIYPYPTGGFKASWFNFEVIPNALKCSIVPDEQFGLDILELPFFGA